MNRILVAVLGAGLASQAFAQAPVTNPTAATPTATTTQNNRNVTCAANDPHFCWRPDSVHGQGEQPSSAAPALPGAQKASTTANGRLSNGAIFGITAAALVLIAVAAGGGGGGGNGTTGTH